MSVSATEAVLSGGLQAFLPTNSAATNSPDKEMFLQLLVAQLQYQDPMNPADTGEFLSQSAQFTALEKMQEVADATAAVLGAQLAFGASGMVGREVTYALEDGTEGSGTVQSVTFGSAGPVLDVDGVAVPLGLVNQVTNGSATSPLPGPDPTEPDPSSNPAA